MSTAPLHKTNPIRRGFTLVELMIVIVIIGILLTLLVPAVQSTRRNARIAQVRTEITGLESALAEFKSKFGEYPPSSIVLCEEADNWATQTQSRAIIRRFWPQFNFGIDRDINGDGNSNGQPNLVLRGAECLVFFLGGVRATGSDIQLLGFSMNPADPFSRGTGTRVGPFFEFNAAQLREESSTTRLLVFLDPLPNQSQPYLYANANDGRGYDSIDVSARLPDGVYRQSAGGAFLKDKSFQIISPGFDASFGDGGAWTEATADTTLVGNREAERDNIPNFHSTTLAPN